jgi:hypothetical protein
LAIIEDDPTPPRVRVLALVETLDHAVLDAPQGGLDHGIAAQILARAVAAVGRPLLAHAPAPTIAATIAAAEAYADDPGDETWRAYFACATDSYPYGAGEGHYGIEAGCEPGSGCVTGAGTLVSVAAMVGFDAVVDALAAELTPWLRTHPARDGQRHRPAPPGAVP